MTRTGVFSLSSTAQLVSVRYIGVCACQIYVNVLYSGSLHVMFTAALLFVHRDPVVFTDSVAAAVLLPPVLPSFIEFALEGKRG